MEKNGCLANSITYNVIVQGLLMGGKCDVVVYPEEMDKRGFSLNASNDVKARNIGFSDSVNFMISTFMGFWDILNHISPPISSVIWRNFSHGALMKNSQNSPGILGHVLTVKLGDV
ncbi:hypothetical protein ACH5RR_007144 [Cinchona calisaya]|uniref:Uncharacterized protein n=1 Tax=Cinchona calisaya TaxID=153742 RepID=A0ABD3AR21_9GENT